MKRRELKPGDIVRVCGYDRNGYYFQQSRLEVIQQVGVLVTLLSAKQKEPFIVHRNQCTPIRIIKKKRREWWVNDKLWKENPPMFNDGCERTWNYWYETKCATYISTTPPENPEGWIKLVEVKWPKGEK